MKYDGGKNGEGVYHKLINLIPPHRVLIEAFFGSGALTRRILPADLNIGIELDPRTIAAVKPHVAMEVKLLEGDALLLLPVFALTLPLFASSEDVLVYADPPYLGETRRSASNIYRREMKSREAHAQLLEVLDALPCRVMLSGYWSELYASRLRPPKWRVVKFIAGTRKGPREECVWLNFPDPEALHDYRFLGENNTDRQRIKRKIERRVQLLRETPSLERAAILEALQGLKTPAATGSLKTAATTRARAWAPQTHAATRYPARRRQTPTSTEASHVFSPAQPETQKPVVRALSSAVAGGS